MMPKPTDAEVDQLIDRTWTVALTALARNPLRDRALEMVEQGASLFCRAVAPGRFEFYIGWFEDPRLRPEGADKFERVVLIRDLPRQALVGAPNPENS